MAEYSGFFDANIVNHEYDRVYLAEHFAKYFSNIVGNGVFGGKSNELIVLQKEQPDMSVRVLSGYGYINGYFYENDDELSLPIDVADGTLSRIDTIVLRFSKVDREIRLAVKKGVAASNPVAPSVERNDDFYELQLAQIYIRAGASSILQSNITDKRLDSTVCGFVVAAIDHLDTADFNLQLEAWMEEFKLESAVEVESLMAQLQEIISEGDIGPLINDVNNLKMLFTESEEYPGCYYRVVNGNTEWLNPPAEPGVEYRLSERFEGKTIFQTTINVASLPVSSRVLIATNFTFTKIVSMEGTMLSAPSGVTAEAFPFPVYLRDSAVPVAMLQGVTTGLAGRNLSIMTTTDLSAYRAHVVFKYIK